METPMENDRSLITGKTEGHGGERNENGSSKKKMKKTKKVIKVVVKKLVKKKVPKLVPKVKKSKKVENFDSQIGQQKYMVSSPIPIGKLDSLDSEVIRDVGFDRSVGLGMLEEEKGAQNYDEFFRVPMGIEGLSVIEKIPMVGEGNEGVIEGIGSDFTGFVPVGDVDQWGVLDEKNLEEIGKSDSLIGTGLGLQKGAGNCDQVVNVPKEIGDLRMMEGCGGIDTVKEENEGVFIEEKPCSGSETPVQLGNGDLVGQRSVVKKMVKKRVLKKVKKGEMGSSNKKLKKEEILEGNSDKTSCKNSSVSQPVKEVERMTSSNEAGHLDGDGGKSHMAAGKLDYLVSDIIGNGCFELGSGLAVEEKAEHCNQTVCVPMEIGNSVTMEVNEPGKEGSLDKSQMAVEENKVVIEGHSNANEKKENSRIMEMCEEGKEVSIGKIQMVGNKNECVIERSYSESEIPVGLENSDLVGNRSDNSGDKVVRVGLEDEGGKEVVEKGAESNMGNGGMVFSGEMEAMERRRRRKTEIFVGGLNTDAKEEDVRKVFEDVGDVVEVRLVINSQTGKNKGYAFVRYASAAEAKAALDKHPKVEICGKQCTTELVEGNDTIFLGNIDKKWKNEDVIKLLKEIGIEKIDKVTVMVDPRNAERNRGFAFLELESHKDAQIAFKKLQNELLGKLQNLKVAWAEPLSEPNEEELLKVKSIYVEYLPPSWDEKKVNNYFKKFGEIENVVLARNLYSSRRKDFAFINFRTREAALKCVETFNNDLLINDGTKVNLKASLAKPIPNRKVPKKVLKSPSKETSTQKAKATQRSVRQAEPRNKGVSAIQTINRTGPMRPNEPRNEGVSTIQINKNRTAGTRSLESSDLEQILAERALWRQTQARLGLMNSDYYYAIPGRERSFSALGDNVYHPDPREYTRTSVENSFPVGTYRHTNYASNFQEMPSQGSSSLHYRRID